ncbi:MAG: tRNA preQ1(34) S-adenosylmethionine ribosyltransferase-isomerase QueA [Anaerolineae bacterium]|nr:tRNA preQ1(34) S-adenosylmethionine ribosyltransferase-isomerase QueA [Phycisphaerae bacterium]
MRTDELDFDLPSELIAQVPARERAQSRLMRYRRADRSIAHRRFEELPALLRAGDLLVFNDARVIPARFTLKKQTGGLVEGLFLSQRATGQWNVLLKNLGPVTSDTELRFVDAPNVSVRVVERGGDGQQLLDVSSDEPAIEFLHRIGRMPLPPYIKREKQHDDRDESDRDRYQTVFARVEGSIAAPTAGLHFTPELLEAIDRLGVQRTTVTLDVGLGTFKPVTAERLEDHAMHVEHYRISREAAEALNRAKSEKRRVIAVGTTSARVLESQPDVRAFEERSAETGILIHPPYQWKHVNALITNFHLPRSTLVALLAALIGLDEQRRAYAEAIEQRYRFFSYGDAMLIE